MLRREGLRLVRQAPRQQNLWAFVAPDRVVTKVISVEEAEHQPSFSQHFPESQDAGLTSEELRFACVSVGSRRAPDGKQHQALELSRFEFETDGSIWLINDT